jgi:transposase InsO family protein
MGLGSVLKIKFVVTTDSNHQFIIAKNTLNRDFYSLKLAEKGDFAITYIRVNDACNYLPTIIDLADRKVVVWSLREGMITQNTVMKTCIDPRTTRNISNSFIFIRIEVSNMRRTK